MSRHSPYLFGVGLALPLLALVAGLQVPSVAAAPHTPTTEVNRTLKGDRLPSMLPGTNANPSGRTSPAATPKLPDGCEASVSAMTRSPLAQTPGRCIS
jgi:hypothetical protein